MAVAHEGTTDTPFTAAGTSFTINFSQVTGQRVTIKLSLVTAQALASVGDDFVNLSNRSGNIHYLYKDLDGSEGGTVVVTVGSSCKACAIADNWSGQDPATPPELSALTSGTEVSGGQNPDTDNIEPSWGSAESAFESFFHQNGEELDDDTWVTAQPTDFIGLAMTTTGTGGASSSNSQAASTYRIVTASSQDPSAYTCAQNRAWEGFTAAHKPDTGGGAVGNRRRRFFMAAAA